MTLLTVRDNLAEVLSADRHYDEAIALYERNMDALLTVVERSDWRVFAPAQRDRSQYLDGR